MKSYEQLQDQCLAWGEDVKHLLAENKDLKAVLKKLTIFVNRVEKETHNMSYEKMHPTLKMYFNHLLVSLKFANQALKESKE